MTLTTSASRRIVDATTAWPGVTTQQGERGELSIRLGRRELGHLHGDHAAHFGFPKDVWDVLHAQGRIVHHPVFPDQRGWAARSIRDADDVEDVIALLRLNYDRAVARHGVPE
jgi:hypothetical protein